MTYHQHCPISVPLSQQGQASLSHQRQALPPGRAVPYRISLPPLCSLRQADGQVLEGLVFPLTETDLPQGFQHGRSADSVEPARRLIHPLACQ